MKRYFIIATLIALVSTAFIATLAFAGDPGSSQFDAMRVDGQWRYIQPKTWVWYYFDYNADADKVKSRIQAWVDNNLNASENFQAAKNVDLAIYTPQQAQDFLRDESIAPIGRGSKPPDGLNISGHDLYWSGNFNFNGRFFAVVKNNNDFPVNYRLYIQGGTVTLFPVPTPTSLYPYLDNPFATPIPSGNVTGTFVFQESSGGNIYTMAGDGTSLKKITNGIDPSWSPDGTKIAFTRWYEPVGMYVINTDGTNETRVWNGQRFQSPRWNPDGKRIAFTQPKGQIDDITSCFGSRCFTVAPDTKWKIGVVELFKVIDPETTKNVLTEPQCSNHCFAPAWSPDGRYIVYADAAVGIMNTDMMTNSIWTMFNRTPKVESPSYSPDGTRVVFQLAQHDHWELAVMDLDGNVLQITQPDPLNFRRVDNVAPTWSPDGKQILFLSNRHGKWEFYVVNADGTSIRQVFKSVTDLLNIQYYFSNERVIDWRR